MFVNVINERLRAVRNSKEHIKKQMEQSFDIKELYDLDHKLNLLDIEEKDLLKQIGDL